MSFKYDFYLAGPFFNPEQVARMDEVKHILLQHGFSVGDPREMGPVIVNTSEEKKTPEFFQKIFDGNIKGMMDSYAILACLDYKDIGTAFELGFFFNNEWPTPVLSFAFDNSKTNVMLSQAVDAHFSSATALEEFLTVYKDRLKNQSFLLTTDLSLNKTKKADTNE